MYIDSAPWHFEAALPVFSFSSNLSQSFYKLSVWLRIPNSPRDTPATALPKSQLYISQGRSHSENDWLSKHDHYG